MRTSVDVQELAEAGARLAPPPMAAASPLLLHQLRRLQGLFHEAIRHRHPVISPGNLMEVPHVEPRVPLAIQPQHQFHLRRRHAPFRRPQQPSVDQATVPVGLESLPPPPERAGRPAQDLRRPEPMQLAAEGLQHHFLHRHRPLPRGLGVRHRASDSSVVSPKTAK